MDDPSPHRFSQYLPLPLYTKVSVSVFKSQKKISVNRFGLGLIPSRSLSKNSDGLACAKKIWVIFVSLVRQLAETFLGRTPWLRVIWSLALPIDFFLRPLTGFYSSPVMFFSCPLCGLLVFEYSCPCWIAVLFPLPDSLQQSLLFSAQSSSFSSNIAIAFTKFRQRGSLRPVLCCSTVHACRLALRCSGLLFFLFSLNKFFLIRAFPIDGLFARGAADAFFSGFPAFSFASF